MGTIANVVTESQNVLISDLAELKKRVKKIHDGVRDMQYAPARVLGTSVPRTARGTVITHGNPDQGQDTREATLSSHPRDLSKLWEEWVNGVNGRLPARLSTREQRGRCSAKYSQRKVFWDCVQRQIDHGATSCTAIQRIQNVYHNKSVTETLKALLEDGRKGGHHLLEPFTPQPRRRCRYSHRYAPLNPAVAAAV